MITITRLGTIPPKPKYRGCCSRCKTEVQCEAKDTAYIPDGPFGQFGYRGVACPLCNSTITVREAQ